MSRKKPSSSPSSSKPKRRKDMSEDDLDQFINDKVMLSDDASAYGEDHFQQDERLLDLPSSSDGEEEQEGWGHSKKAYYSGDKGAFKEEAAEAKRIQQKRLGKMREEDFGVAKKVKATAGTVTLNLTDDEDDEPSEEGFDGLSEEESYVSDDASGESDEASDEDASDEPECLDGMTQEEKIQFLQEHSSEFAALMAELKQNLACLEEHLTPLMQRIDELPSSDGLTLLASKYQLLSAYCSACLMYVTMRLKGQSLKGNHPLLLKLAKYRLLLEKIRPLEIKLKSQIDRLLEASQKTAADGSTTQQRLKAHLDMMVDSDGEQEDEDDAAEDKATYKAPRVAPVAMVEGKSRREVKKVTRHAELASDQDSDAPSEEALDQVYGRRAEQRQAKRGEARDAYEEENLVRFTLNRREKHEAAQLQAKPIDELDALDDFFEEMASKRKELPSQKSSKRRTLESADALDKKKTFKKAKVMSSDDNDDEIDSDMSEIEDDLAPSYQQQKRRFNHDQNDIYSQALQRKQAKQQQGRPTAPIRHRPIQDMTDPNATRPINYAIKKNKGLTPHRPKENRNPRVKRRMQFEKASKRLGSFKPVAKGAKGPYRGESSGIRTNISKSAKY